MTSHRPHLKEVPSQAPGRPGSRATAIGPLPEAARFVAILAPDERWSVFDCRTECPAEIAGQCLMGLSREEAVTTAKRLNDRLRRFGDWEAAR